MTALSLRLFGDPVLKTAARPVEEFGDGLRNTAAEMLDIMDASGGVGLAANQVGLSIRLFVYDCNGMRGHLVNPVWHQVGGDTQTGVEGCLSVPGVSGTITRAAKVLATGHDVQGRPVTIAASGLLARCIQHETDHLDGVMFMQRMEREERKAAMAAIHASEWWKEN